MGRVADDYGAVTTGLLPTGAGDAKPLTKDALTHNWAHWLPDGQHILFAGNEAGKANRFYLMGLDGQPPKAISREGVDALQFAISIDSKEIAGIGPDAQGYLYPIAGGDPRPIPGFARRGADRVARRKGAIRHETRRASGKDHAHRRDDRAAVAMRELMPPDSAGVQNIGPIRVTPDGKTYVYGFQRRLSDLYLVEGLK